MLNIAKESMRRLINILSWGIPTDRFVLQKKEDNHRVNGPSWLKKKVLYDILQIKT